MALQGGGAFGAFTWGVLDRLLEGDIVIEAVSGASAGAVNGVLLAEGLRKNGPEGARELLERFWTKLADTARRSFVTASARSALALDLSTRVLSPYVLNPFNLNPLRDLLVDLVDFPALQKAAPLRLLIAATRVSDGGLRIFREDELALEAVLASSCLPLLHHAVEIEGESYWDGGYVANPPLLPLLEASEASRLLLVQIIPAMHDGVPTSSPTIVKRLNQITFNTPLHHDIEALGAMKRLSEAEGNGTQLGRKLSELRLDHLSAQDWVPDLAERSILDLDRDFLLQLKQRGREAAGEWLAGNPR